MRVLLPGPSGRSVGRLLPVHQGFRPISPASPHPPAHTTPPVRQPLTGPRRPLTSSARPPSAPGSSSAQRALPFASSGMDGARRIPPRGGKPTIPPDCNTLPFSRWGPQPPRTLVKRRLVTGSLPLPALLPAPWRALIPPQNTRSHGSLLYLSGLLMV